MLEAETDCVDCVDEVKCWGANAHGQLGIGNAEFAGSFSNSMGDALPSVNLGRDWVRREPEAAWSRTPRRRFETQSRPSSYIYNICMLYVTWMM